MLRIETKDNEQDYRFIRETVFMNEQGFTQEFDDIDSYATHLTLYDDGVLVGCARIYPLNKVEYKIGRIAILKQFRKRGYGSIIVNACEQEVKLLGGTTIILDAQKRAQPFYEFNGYQAYGDIHYDEGEEHIFMKKIITIN